METSKIFIKYNLGLAKKLEAENSNKSVFDDKLILEVANSSYGSIKKKFRDTSTNQETINPSNSREKCYSKFIPKVKIVSQNFRKKYLKQKQKLLSTTNRVKASSVFRNQSICCKNNLLEIPSLGLNHGANESPIFKKIKQLFHKPNKTVVNLENLLRERPKRKQRAGRHNKTSNCSAANESRLSESKESIWKVKKPIDLRFSEPDLNSQNPCQRDSRFRIDEECGIARNALSFDITSTVKNLDKNYQLFSSTSSNGSYQVQFGGSFMDQSKLSKGMSTNPGSFVSSKNSNLTHLSMQKKRGCRQNNCFDFERLFKQINVKQNENKESRKSNQQPNGAEVPASLNLSTKNTKENEDIFKPLNANFEILALGSKKILFHVNNKNLTKVDEIKSVKEYFRKKNSKKNSILQCNNSDLANESPIKKRSSSDSSCSSKSMMDTFYQSKYN